MFFLGGNYVPSLTSTLKSKNLKKPLKTYYCITKGITNNTHKVHTVVYWLHWVIYSALWDIIDWLNFDPLNL